MWLHVLRMAFATVVTTCVFSLVALFGLVLYVILTPPARAADCVITTGDFTNVLLESGEYNEGQAMPPGYIAGFIKNFNEEPPKSGDSDGVTIFQHKEMPLVAVVFSKGDCFVSNFLMPIPVFMGIFKKSQGDAL